MDPIQTFIRVKIGALAEEARVIRRYEQRAKVHARHPKNKDIQEPTQALRHELQQHRLNVVRPAARSAQLALAFLRDKQYQDTELPREGNAPNWRQVANLIKRMGMSRYAGSHVEQLTEDLRKWGKVELTSESHHIRWERGTGKGQEAHVA